MLSLPIISSLVSLCMCLCEAPDVIGRWSVRACPVSLVERSESCDLQEAVRERERETLVRSMKML